jgi:MFS family permease
MTAPEAETATPLVDPLHPRANLFGHRDFSLFLAARVLSTLAVSAEAVTLGWQVYAVARTTRSVDQSAFLVGMVGLVQFAPLFALTLFAGAATDRYDRRLILLGCLLAEGLCDGLLGLEALQPHPSLLAIFSLAAVFGAVRAFPGASAIAPMLVPRPLLPRALAWNSLAWQSGSVFGPMLAGLLVGISSAVAYGTAAALYALAALLVLMIRGPTRPPPTSDGRIQMIKEGLDYVRSNRVVLGAISLDLFAVLLGGATALLPVFARDVLHVGAEGFGLLRAGPAIGAGLAAFVLSRSPMRRHAGLWMFSGVAAFALATIGFALSKSLLLSVLLLAVLGAGDMLSVYVRQILVQISTPEAMRGRVSAISSVFVGASNELGEFETGLIARLLGPVGAALAGGIGSLLITGIWSRLFPSLRRADRLLGD